MELIWIAVTRYISYYNYNGSVESTPASLDLPIIAAANRNFVLNMSSAVMSRRPG